MSDPLRLILFDVDGTLVDSQTDILASMQVAFQEEGLTPPHDQAILALVGISLDKSIPMLAPDQSTAVQAAMVDRYKAHYMHLRKANGTKSSSPLYPGILNMLEALAVVDPYLLGVVTGKSRRGLDALLDGHDLRHRFLTLQTSDHHPSKPHPAMLHAAMDDMGIMPENTVMIGDTTYDLEMARSAGTRAIGVSWGYHAPETLRPLADAIVDAATELPSVISTLWETPS